jgi:tetratricopeptide (TPR) repeat protein
MDLSSITEREASWAKLENALRSSGGHLVVSGPPGSGRGMLLRWLSERKGFVAIEPPPLDDSDAGLHALLQGAAHLDRAALDRVQHDEAHLADRATRLAESFRDVGRGLVIRLPLSWRIGADLEDDSSPDRAVRRRRGEQVITGLTAVEENPIVLLVGAADDLPLGLQGWHRLALDRLQIPTQALDDLSGFGTFVHQAREVAQWCKRSDTWPTPIQFRLTVGLRAMGVVDDRIVPQLARTASGMQLLENLLVDSLRARPEALRMAFRLALARRPIPRGQIASITGVDEDRLPLFTECLAYGADAVSMHDRVRTAVLGLLLDRTCRSALRAVEADARPRLAAHHGTLDGASNASEASSVVDWLERVHHLASAGPGTDREWLALDLRCREFFWDRGRALSRQGHYDAAARVYRDCIRRFGADDAYAQHYFGFNADRAATDRLAAEAALRDAVALEPMNAWFNGRLVTFLIGQTRFLEARREWLDALGRVDPTGEIVRRNPWLARHLHRWVVSAWLDHAEVEIAREAFDMIPRHVLEEDWDLRSLQDRLRDAEEARSLGESVYPASIPVEDRWGGPRVVPPRSGTGATLRAWYPGRVVQGTENGVVLVFATPADDPGARRVKVRELTEQEWARAARTRPEDASGFVEIGSYLDGDLLIVSLDERAPTWSRPADPDAELRYLARWDPRE